MAGIRKREIVGCTLAIALFGVVASPAFAATVDLGQTSVSTDTDNLVQTGSTGSSESPGGSDAVSDLADTVTDASGASTETSVDPSPVPDPSTGQPADQTGSTSPPLEQQSAAIESGAVGQALTDLANAAGQTAAAAPPPKADPAPAAPAPRVVTSLASTARKVADTVRKAGAPADATKSVTDTAAMLTRDPVGTAPALVDAVQKDASAVVGMVSGGDPPSMPGLPGGGALPGLLGAITYVTQVLDPVVAIAKDPIRLVSVTVQQLPPASTRRPDLAAHGSEPPLASGVTSSLGAPAVPTSESPLPKQLHFAGSSPGTGPPPPGAPAGEAGPAYAAARATAPGAASGPGPMNGDGISLSIHSLALLGVASSSPSAVDGAGVPYSKLPGAPPQPELPALGGISFSTALSFGAFAALAVMLAAIAARPGLIRRLALAGGRPVALTLLLDRPG